MPTYSIDSKTSKLVVTAHSSVHDSDTSWQGIAGTISADPANMETTEATITVDMTTADAGDWLKNRKLRKDMDFEKHPSASFVVTSVTGLEADGSRHKATVHGKLSWRGKTIEIEAQGEGTVTDNEIVATGHFAIDMTRLGIKAPKVLMLKIEDVVSCKIDLRARA